MYEELNNFHLKPIIQFLETDLKEKMDKKGITAKDVIDMMITEKADVHVKCLDCGMPFPIYDTKHECHELDKWLYAYTIGKSVRNLTALEERLIQQRFQLNDDVTLYRGVNAATKEEADIMLSKFRNGIYECDSYSSWTKDLNIAVRYAKFQPSNPESDAYQYRYENMAEARREGKRIVGERGFVLQMNVVQKENVLADIHQKNFGIFDEKEVIFRPGTYEISIVDSFIA